MQELFLKLNNAHNSRKVKNWDSYARRAAVNLAFDWRRKRKSPALALEQVPEPICPDDSPLSCLVRAEELEETLDAIGQLRETSRRALVMRYIQQQSYEHIADDLGKTTHQIRALCARALAHLRETLTSARLPSTGKESYDVKNE
jgi:RNA polymerase sigma factor (sigma-70 family)